MLHIRSICSTTKLSAVVMHVQWLLDICEHTPHVHVVHQYFKMHALHNDRAQVNVLPSATSDTWDFLIGHHCSFALVLCTQVEYCLLRLHDGVEREKKMTRCCRQANLYLAVQMSN